MKVLEILKTTEQKIQTPVLTEDYGEFECTQTSALHGGSDKCFVNLTWI